MDSFIETEQDKIINQSNEPQTPPTRKRRQNPEGPCRCNPCPHWVDPEDAFVSVPDARSLRSDMEKEARRQAEEAEEEEAARVEAKRVVMSNITNELAHFSPPKEGIEPFNSDSEPIKGDRPEPGTRTASPLRKLPKFV